MALFRDAFTLFLMYCFFIIQLKTFVIIVVVDLLFILALFSMYCLFIKEGFIFNVFVY